MKSQTPIIHVHVSGVLEPQEAMCDVCKKGGDALPPVIGEGAAEVADDVVVQPSSHFKRHYP